MKLPVELVSPSSMLRYLKYPISPMLTTTAATMRRRSAGTATWISQLSTTAPTNTSMSKGPAAA